MNPRTVIATQTIEYYIESDVMTPTWDECDLVFVGPYERTHDADGYYVPKRMIEEEKFTDHAHEVLDSAGLLEQFRREYRILPNEADSVDMKTIYTASHDLGAIAPKDQLVKRTRYQLCIERRPRKKKRMK
jgi:hypothetical protein